ncbi:hypothetical protein quinque_013463 [Culex quinquefasciatus]
MATNTTTVDDKHNNKQFRQSSYVQGCQSSIDGRIGENSMTLDIAVRMLMMQFTEMKLMLETFRNDFNLKIDTIKSELQGKVSVLQSDITTLKTEYEGKFVNQDAALGQINHRVNHLYLNIGALENQKELIISGVPFVSDEDPDALFAMICRQLECSEERDLAYKDWRTAASDVKDLKRRTYKTLRNRANSVIERAKKTFLGGYLDANIPSKLLWTRVKSLGVGKDKSSQPCDHDPDEVNRMFLSSFTPAETRNDQHARILPSQYNFSFRNVHYWEVVNAICEVKSNAVGMDGLPIRFLKIVLPLVIQQITHMFNLFINTSTFPNLWKHAKVLPLKKKSNSNDVTNLRPISILCSLSKAFEKLLDQQMANYIDNNHLLTEHQAGFRKGQSVKTAALRVHDDLASTIDKRGVGVLVLLDFSKAFDTIPTTNYWTSWKPNSAYLRLP